MFTKVFSILPRYSSRTHFRVTCHSATQAKNEKIINFEQFPLFLLTQSQREAPARANNILRLPPSELDKLKMRSNGLPKIYFDAYRVRPAQSEREVLIRQKHISMPTSNTRTVTMKITGLTEIYFDAYRVKQATVKLKSSAPVEGQLFTLSRPTEKNSCTSVLPWALSHGHRRIGKIPRPNSTRLWEMDSWKKSSP